MLLTILHAVVVTFYWVMVKLVVSPVEGLLRINGWRVELRLTASLTFSTIEHGEVLNRVIHMQIRFPWEDFCEWRKEQGRANALSLSGGGDAELYGDETEKERRAAELSSDSDEAEKERSALHAVPAVQRMIWINHWHKANNGGHLRVAHMAVEGPERGDPATGLKGPSPARRPA
ncbi:hypothetical protein EI94DRAFT_1706689 [Lactarius quietus]|nr:hypothetical protein EI94DRAFT_1706689 [Lactarius quietus]